MQRKTTLAALALLLASATTLNAQTKMETPSPSTLSPKEQAIATLASFEAKGDTANLKKAAAEAFDAALLTVNEAKEVCSHLYAYTGFPRSLNALGTLQKLLEERAAAGKHDTTGAEASPLLRDFDALAEGTAVQTRLRGGHPLTYSFAPATDYYLKAHLFGDIFARDVLTHSEREIATVSALAAMPGVEAQLKSHVSGSRNMGVTDAQLHALPGLLRTRVGEMEGHRAAKAVAEVFGEKFDEGKPLGNAVFPKGEPNTAFAKYFTGNSYLATVLGEGKLPVYNVTFEPRCRNNWHIHHRGGQVLICVGGEGWYQEWGKPARRLRPGDTVSVPPETKHWHGAAAKSWFAHLAIEIPAEGATNEWLEPVSDAEYDVLEE